MKRNRIIYLFLFLTALTYVYFEGGLLPWTLFYFSMAIPLVSIAYTVLVYFRFKYVEDIEGRYFTKGDIIHYKFCVHNEDILVYPYIKVRFHASEILYGNQLQENVFTLTPFCGRTFKFKIQCAYRGIYELGISSIEIYDFLNIFRLRYKPSEAKQIIVYPRIVPIDAVLTNETSPSEIRTVNVHKQIGSSSFYNLREYVVGDDLRNIHWKLSAKLNDFIVRKYDTHMEDNINLILDLTPSCDNREMEIIIEDRIIEAATAICNHFLTKWFTVDLIYYQGNYKRLTGNNPSDFNSFYNMLAKVEFTSELPIDMLMLGYMYNQNYKSSIFIFTAQPTAELYEKMMIEVVNGNRVNLIYIEHESVADREMVRTILSNAVKLGIHVTIIDADNVKEALEAG